MSNNVAVSVGDQVYLEHSEESFGSVRHVSQHDLTIDIENFGDVTIPASAVVGVQPGKILVLASALPTNVRHAIGRAHLNEDK